MGNMKTFSNGTYTATSIKIVIDKDNIIPNRPEVILQTIDNVKTTLDNLLHITIRTVFGTRGFQQNTGRLLFIEPGDRNIKNSKFYRDSCFTETCGDLKIRHINVFNLPMDDTSTTFHFIVQIKHDLGDENQEKIWRTEDKLEYALVCATTIMMEIINSPFQYVDVADSKFTKEDFEKMTRAWDDSVDIDQMESIMQEVSRNLED